VLARRLALLASYGALAAALPAAAHAATVRTIEIDEPAAGIAVAGDGTVHVIEREAKADVVFAPDGTQLRKVALPATPRAKNAAVQGPDGRVWVALDDVTAPGFARVDAAGGVDRVPTRCPPWAMAADPAAGALYFSLPLTMDPSGPPCTDDDSPVRTVWRDGSITPFADGRHMGLSEGIAVAAGKLFVSDIFAGVVRRYAWAGAPGVEATIALTDNPAGVAAGADGQIYVALAHRDAIDRFAPDAPDGTVATELPAGGQRFALVADPVANLAAVGPAGLAYISPSGTVDRVPLPNGAPAANVVAVGDERWVTAAGRRELYRVVDAKPTVRITSPDPHGPLFEVDPHGNDTSWTFTARHGALAYTFRGTDTMIGPIRRTVRLPAFLPAGDWDLTLTASNARGEAATTARGTVVARPRTPKTPPPFAQVASIASTVRCLAKPKLTLKLSRAKNGVTVERLDYRVGNGKVRQVGGMDLQRPIALAGLPKRGKYTIRFSLAFSDGTKLVVRRTYRACAVKPKAKKHRKHGTAR
jgi:sugar lactone lactonase YvrE